MQAAVVRRPHTLLIEDVPDPTPGRHDVVLTVEANGLCGSDIHLLDGEWAAVTYPMILGHEFAGTVVATGSDVTSAVLDGRYAVDPTLACGVCDRCLAGRRNICRNLGAYGVTADGGSASLVVVRAGNLVPIPDDLPWEAAAISQPLACAVHALRRIGDGVEGDVLVVGAGAAGLLLAQTAKVYGAASVHVCDPLSPRRDVARQLDVDGVHADIGAACDSVGRSFDLVVDATGSVDAMAPAFAAVDTGGTLLMFGICGHGETATIEPVRFYEREVRVIGSRGLNGTQPEAVRLLADGLVLWQPLVNDLHPLADLPEALARVRSGLSMKAVTMGSAS